MGFVITTPGARAAADQLNFVFNRTGQERNRATMRAHLRNRETNPGHFATQTPVLVQLLTALNYFQGFTDAEHGRKFTRWLVYLRQAWQANPAKATAYPSIGGFLTEKIDETPYLDITFDWEEIADRGSPTATLTKIASATNVYGAWKITAYTVPLDKISGSPGKSMAVGAATKKLKGRKTKVKKAKKKAAKPKRALKKGSKKRVTKKRASRKSAKRHR